MKILKTFSIGLLFLVLTVIGLFFYLDSDFVEIRRLRGQVENNFKLKLSELPELVDRESYGWAEEGGDISLLMLNSKDCLLISSAMTDTEVVNEKSKYIKVFMRNNFYPKKLKTWRKSNSHGDFFEYALDVNSCVLYRKFHYE